MPQSADWSPAPVCAHRRAHRPFPPAGGGGDSAGRYQHLRADAVDRISQSPPPFGLASDIGGSIRVPALFCGVFGHKPSSGLVPTSGNFPSNEAGNSRLLGVGPVARRAEDLIAVLRIIAGPDGVDTTTQPAEIGDPTTVSSRDCVSGSPRDVLAADQPGALRRPGARRRSAGRCRSPDPSRSDAVLAERVASVPRPPAGRVAEHDRRSGRRVRRPAARGHDYSFPAVRTPWPPV